jgi:hypothetical protein
MKKIAISVVLMIMAVSWLFAQTPLHGPYLGQKPPGLTPELYAPGIVNTGLFTRDMAMTPHMDELYFSVQVGGNTYATIVCCKMKNGRWSQPEIASFSDDPRYVTLEPCISPDGKKFLFTSNRPAPGQTIEHKQFDLWCMDRVADGWSEPYPLTEPINTKTGQYFPSLTRDGTLYYTHEEDNGINLIYRAKWEQGAYAAPEKLGPQVNCGRHAFNAFISPDESYIIVCTFGRTDSKGSTDYYIVFRNPNDTWSDPINMGEQINTQGGEEYSPYVSPDGRYFFFMSSRLAPDNFKPGEKWNLAGLQRMAARPGNGLPNIYWMDAGIIQELKTKAVFSGK